MITIEQHDHVQQDIVCVHYAIYLLYRYAADGSRREGDWINDLLDGFATFTCKSCNKSEEVSEGSKHLGTVKIERWRQGRRIGDGARERSPIVNVLVG